MSNPLKKLAISAIRTGGHVVMLPFEKTAKPASIRMPPVFIIGAPRSGTSLLYELMITRLRFAYISNAAHRFFRTPLTATRLFKNAIANWRGDFSSSYGHIDGWGAPNEGGWVWQRWLADSDWTDGADISSSDIEELRALTTGLSSIMAAPFLNKNVMHSNRLRLMHKIWPDALYLEVKRDVRDNARSIIRAERVEAGPETTADVWWSVRPRLAKDFAGKSDTERAIAQVIGVSRDIADDIPHLGPDRLHIVDYGDLCAEPETALMGIQQFLGSHGCMAEQRMAVPESFPIRPSRLLSEKDEAIMDQTLSSLGKDI